MKRSACVERREEEVPTARMSEAARRHVMAVLRPGPVLRRRPPPVPKPAVELDSVHLEEDVGVPEGALRLTSAPDVPSVTVKRLRVRRRSPSQSFMPRPYRSVLAELAAHPVTMIVCVVLACATVALAIAAAAGRLPLH
jgi:hypothetical protein